MNTVFTAPLHAVQFMMPTGAGVSAFSEASFSFLLPDIQSRPILFFDDPLSIGANQSTGYIARPTLTTSLVLQPNALYSFDLDMGGEVSGASLVTPEPASVALLFTAAVLTAAISRQRRRRLPA